MRLIAAWALVGCLFSISATASVIGDDNRQTATSDDKETAGIGVVISQFAGEHNRFKCTGTLIGQRLILTAAHCIFKQDNGGFAQAVSFFPGAHQSNRSEPNLKYAVEKFWVARQFVNAEENGLSHSWYTDRSDIALLQIKSQTDESPGERFGMKNLTQDFSPVVPGQKYLGNFASYPSDKPDAYSPWKEVGCEYWSPNSETFSTSCDTAIGSSGGALLTKNNEVIGVISSFTPRENFATRITASTAREIQVIADGGEGAAEYFIFNRLSDVTGLIYPMGVNVSSK